MKKIARIGVSLPESLLNEFDLIIRTRGYSSRSEAIRDAIRNYISEYKWMEKEDGEIIGVLTIIYDHDIRGVSDAVIDLQHEFGDIITSSMHIHLSKDMCLELVLVRGDMKRIKMLVDKTVSIKGVSNVKLITAFRE